MRDDFFDGRAAIIVTDPLCCLIIWVCGGEIEIVVESETGNFTGQGNPSF